MRSVQFGGPAIEAADALVIAASSSAHPELIRAGIARGIPIFCEKPLATDLTEIVTVQDGVSTSEPGPPMNNMRWYSSGVLLPDARENIRPFPPLRRTFPDEWIAAWNSHDLDAIMSHYADDVTLIRSLQGRRALER